MTSVHLVCTVYEQYCVLSSCSGLLLMNNVMRRLKRNDGEIHWGKFYLHRYLRYCKSAGFIDLQNSQMCCDKETFSYVFYYFHEIDSI